MDRATLTFLQTFPERIRREGEELHRSGCVKQIFGNHLFVQGRVDDGGIAYRTTLRLVGDEWVSSCSSDQGGRSSAVYATMLERVERGTRLPEAPNEVGAQSLADALEEKLGRPLADQEELFVEKLEKRYRRFEIEQEIYDHDLVRLNSKWPTESYEPLELWNEPPTDIAEFWNYIAYAFSKRNLGFPPFLEPLTDLETTRDRIFAWEKERELHGWRERIDSALERPPARPTTAVELRLMVLPNEARLQWRPAGGAPDARFAPLGDGLAFAELEAHTADGAVRLDGPSDLLWARAAETVKQAEGSIFKLDEPGNASLLARLLEQPELAEHLVTLDERPLRHHDSALRWLCEEANPDTGDYALQLVMTDGEPVSHSLRVLPGHETLYLSDETVFRGPPEWTGTSEIDPRYEIPAEVLASETGVAFLSTIGSELPPSLRERTDDVVLGVSLDMRLHRRLTGADSEHLVVSALARDSHGRREETLGKDGWVITANAAAENGRLRRFDRRRLHEIPPFLERGGLSYDLGQEAFKTRATKAFPDKFREWFDTLPPHVEVTMDEELQTLLNEPLKARVRFEVTGGEIDWFDLKIVLDVEGLDLTQAELRALVAARGEFVRMKEGGWLRLEFDLDDAQRAAVDRLGLDIFDLSGEEHRMHVLQLADPAAKEVFDEKAWDTICERSASLKLKVNPALPDALDATLRNYQVEGFHFLAYLTTNRFGGILADDMGLGKTVQSIAWLLWMRQQASAAPNGGKPGGGRKKDGGGPPVAAPSLVVCPKSVLDVWAGECRKFAPSLRVQVVRTKEEIDLAKLGGEIDLLVLNYSQLRVNDTKLKSVRWLAVILDEGQQIKNPDSKAAKAARALDADNRLVLTGTPIENRLLDMWSLMAFAMPGVLGNRKYFRDRFDRRKDTGAQVRLSARLRPFLLRRTKGQVAMDLPPRIEEDIYCKMEGVQEELYQDELKRIQNILLGLESDEALRRSSFVVLQGLMRLRQICCHPSLISGGHEGEESAKMNALFYLLDQLRDEGHKVLVFSQFVSMLDIIRARLEKEKRPFAYLTGQTKNRHEVIEGFQTTSEPSVFLLSLKAGGSGLNLTSASYVVLYDPWWNPAVENQAIDRTHRIGQTNKVIAYRLLMRESVEEKIRVLQEQKTSLVTGVLGQESFTKNLTREDLRFLFESPPS